MSTTVPPPRPAAPQGSQPQQGHAGVAPQQQPQQQQQHAPVAAPVARPALPFACLTCGQTQMIPLANSNAANASVFGCATCQSSTNSGKVLTVTRTAPTWHWSR